MAEERMEQTEGTADLDELFREVEAILSRMEDREVSLEDSFALYEQGMKKIRDCNARLDLVEKKMKMIAQDGREVPFE